jgi:hypothetical protein
MNKQKNDVVGASLMSIGGDIDSNEPTVDVTLNGQENGRQHHHCSFGEGPAGCHSHSIAFTSIHVTSHVKVRGESMRKVEHKPILCHNFLLSSDSISLLCSVTTGPTYNFNRLLAP